MEKNELWRRPWVTVGFSALSDEAVGSILIFGAGGPLTADVEESCARARLHVAAAVLNGPGPAFSIDPGRLLDLKDLRPALRALPFLCPLFTSANRGIAVTEALARGLKPALALVDPTTILAAGSVLRRDLPPGVLAAGNPARIHRSARIAA